MLYYDENGELQTGGSEEEALAFNAFANLRSASYPLSPSSAKDLRGVLGPYPPESASQARDLAQQALEDVGLGEVPLDIALEEAGGEWAALVAEPSRNE